MSLRCTLYPAQLFPHTRHRTRAAKSSSCCSPSPCPCSRRAAADARVSSEPRGELLSGCELASVAICSREHSVQSASGALGSRLSMVPCIPPPQQSRTLASQACLLCSPAYCVAHSLGAGRLHQPSNHRLGHGCQNVAQQRRQCLQGGSWELCLSKMGCRLQQQLLKSCGTGCARHTRPQEHRHAPAAVGLPTGPCGDGWCHPALLGAAPPKHPCPPDTAAAGARWHLGVSNSDRQGHITDRCRQGACLPRGGGGAPPVP